ncbi:N-(5'-phosphoribosyl)anthranilate isomerase [Aliarcobacter skirrowii]|jgi:phosphoribosylanthranilate isomerase|uniref:N-(5'-phosphoribosyl)anthranilate isomerase n=2 Tax=Aliarcobacter skirrowii TaxID=28200 RepID=A0AAD0WNK7_9BACT|nr:phosphoribosylanthranilate isomerase [Aliarcobacter skirrowii]AXX84989.1 phosphoribosylanthranilate isomerase [Aliarcobacter skirrowii CCUG 10374]AZL54075.1 phosphoribosylanthranilate isomerase [Aliarcobacter skirrowii]KAB0620848.1 phosphoribosylanthranilate isomerase [Aliarcobacter skirrowii CCUG 10374]MDD2508731.1 phosphoribosylanthranilate isomerase [Aliarcobacter skirrowii]MDD3496943.1 phosphoribosylanthranilate isomerase [Aliarcobacter skirrowii]
MRVKICGITNKEDAHNATKAGASALGFVFYKDSPRYIEPKEALKIVNSLPPFIQSVALFVNETTDFINQVCKDSKMQLAQIIDDENIVDYENLEVKYLKVLRVKTKEDLINLENNYYLVDAFVEEFGGAGKRLALEWFKDIDCSKFILAGGLSSENLKELNGFNFFAVDVSSAVEKQKGIKDREKMVEFVKAANEII